MKLVPVILATLGLFVLVTSPSVFVGFQGAPRQIESRRASATALKGVFGDFEAPQADKEQESASDETSPFRYGSAALSMMAALVVAFWPLAEAQAARSGGRMGSMGGGSSRGMGSMGARRTPPPPPTARRFESSPGPSVTNRSTVINRTYVAPPVVVATPMYGGFGGFGGFGGGYGLFGPPPTLGDVVVGSIVGNAISNSFRGPSGTDRMLEGQMRQDERQMDSQAREIDALKRQIEDMKSSKGAAAPAATPGMVTIAVTVPEGKGPGQSLAVKAPDGPTYEVKVPEGVAAGQSFQVQLPAAQK